MLAASATASAQARSALDLGGAALAGGEEVAYLRALGLLDTVRVPVLVQPFSRHEQQRLRLWAGERESPWRGRFSATPSSSGGSSNGARELFKVLRPQLTAVYHSSLPLSRNDGVAWTGRGATLVAQGGATFSWRVIDAQFAPLAFAAQNAAFDLAPNGEVGRLGYGDPRFPNNIDHSQAFGSAAYSRLDLGESFIRLEALGFSSGFSSATMSWGPGREYPLVISPNSGGFSHLYVGTSRPLNVWVGHIDFRLIGGRIEQSEYSPVTSGNLHRFTSALVGSFEPRGLRGLEIGATRMMQVAWPTGGPTLSQILRPLQTVVSNPDLGAAPNQNTENQFASVFVRVAPPASGIEAFAELTRDDFAGNLRTLLVKPDDISLLTLGISRAKLAADGSLHLLRVEITNGELSHNERGQRGLKEPYWTYGHFATLQGLTSRGQLLGSPVAAGGAGGTIAWERYSRAGRISVSAERQLRSDWLPSFGETGGTRDAETMYGVRFERLKFSGSREWVFTFAPSRILNRNLVRGNDLWNLELGGRWRGW